jgi:coproporphyrinogen III oxidase
MHATVVIGWPSRHKRQSLPVDSGTGFGLKAGRNPEAVLMSLPPVAKWP